MLSLEAASPRFSVRVIQQCPPKVAKGYKRSSRYYYMGVSLNGGTPKPSILIRFSIINDPLRGTPIFGNIPVHHNRVKIAT